jgi:hypothetical protein
MHVPFLLSQIMMTGLLLGMVLSVCTCWFHHMATLPSWLVSTNFSTCSYQCSLSNFIPISLHTLKCSWAHTVTCLFMYCSFAHFGHADIMWSDVWSDCWHNLHFRSLFVIFLLHDISYVVSDIVVLLFHFQFCFRISPRQP